MTESDFPIIHLVLFFTAYYTYIIGQLIVCFHYVINLNKFIHIKDTGKLFL